MNLSESDNDSLTDCAISKSIADDIPFRFFLILEVLVACLAFSLNCILLWILYYVSVFHRNLRIILAHISLSLLFYAAACGVKEIITLYEIFDFRNSECRLVAKAFDCKLRELTNTIPIGITVFLSLALCIERLYSTVRYRFYDQDHNWPWLAFFLVPSCWVPILWAQLSGLVHISFEKTVPICESLISMNRSGAVQVLATNLSVEILVVITALYLYFWNNYKLKVAAANRAKHTLSSRFQISQNVQMNSLMLPSMLFQSFCYLPNYLFLIVVIEGIPFRPVTKTWLLHVNYLWKEVYAVAHPLLALKRNVHIMEQLQKRCPALLLKLFGLKKSTVKVTPVIMIKPAPLRHLSTTDLHFQMLDRIWEKKSQPRRAPAYCSETDVHKF